ncbi:hypothetical protein Pcinc_015284 [Petrolisthes cinctipes]|uniref:Uncharacterized protein n=1 Tax=Petrolisthes cinctipes TaxID=88211 RepID=A0AAE1FTN2_PETCI|nr:hypothetical protein Pcinc_015284 [Petrolisthes cinctipes]
MESISRSTFRNDEGRDGFIEFMSNHCEITDSPDDRIKKSKLISYYTAFCCSQEFPVISQICMGRYLSRVGVWRGAREGGRNGQRGKLRFAYAGLKLVFQSMSSSASPLPQSELDVNQLDGEAEEIVVEVDVMSLLDLHSTPQLPDLSFPASPQQSSDLPCSASSQQSHLSCPASPQQSDLPCPASPHQSSDLSCSASPHQSSDLSCPASSQQSDPSCPASSHQSSDLSCPTSPQQSSDQSCSASPQQQSALPCPASPHQSSDQSCPLSPLLFPDVEMEPMAVAEVDKILDDLVAEFCPTTPTPPVLQPVESTMTEVTETQTGAGSDLLGDDWDWDYIFGETTSQFSISSPLLQPT